MNRDTSLSVTLGRTGVAAKLHDECASVGESIDPSVAGEVERAVVTVLAGEGIHTGSVDIFFVDAEQIAELNRVHLGHDGPTDVLSFPLDDPSEADGFGFVPHLGDVVICPLIADHQAPDHAGDLRAEVLLLAVHGALHLLGHDHAGADERADMQALEARYLRGFGVAHPGDQR